MEHDEIVISTKEEQRELLEDAKERRRYALLNAAALIWPACIEEDTSSIEEAVELAEQLLAEIEKREKAEGSS